MNTSEFSQQQPTTALAVIRDKLMEPESIAQIARAYKVDENKATKAIGDVLRVIVNADPTTKLQECSPASIKTAIIDSATLGLYVNNLQHAHLIARWNAKKGVQEASLQIGYRGYLYKLNQRLKNVDVQVYIVENPEDFSFVTEDGYAKVTFSPKNPFFDKYAEAAGAFCHITYMVGEEKKSVVEVLPQSEIIKIRAAAKTQKFWDKWAGEKIKVAAIRRACKHRFASIVDDLDIHDNEDYDLDKLNENEASGSVSSSLKETLRREREGDEGKEVLPEQNVSEADYEEIEEPKATATEEEYPASAAASTAEAEGGESGDDDVESDSPIIDEWDGKTIETQDGPVSMEWEGVLHAFNYVVNQVSKITDSEDRETFWELNAPFTNALIKEGSVEQYDSLRGMCLGKQGGDNE